METCPAVGYIANCVNTYAASRVPFDGYWVPNAVGLIVLLIVCSIVAVRRNKLVGYECG